MDLHENENSFIQIRTLKKPYENLQRLQFSGISLNLLETKTTYRINTFWTNPENINKPF